MQFPHEVPTGDPERGKSHPAVHAQPVKNGVILCSHARARHWDWMVVVRKPGTIGDPGTKAELREMGLAWLWCAFAMAEISRGIEIARIQNAKSAKSANSAND